MSALARLLDGASGADAVLQTCRLEGFGGEVYGARRSSKRCDMTPFRRRRRRASFIPGSKRLSDPAGRSAVTSVTAGLLGRGC
jgi:hypothetical protein